MATIRPPGLEHVRDQRIERTVPLVTPAALLEELPLSEDQAEVVVRGRRDVAAVLDGDDDRLLVVVGPLQRARRGGGAGLRHPPERAGRRNSRRTC